MTLLKYELTKILKNRLFIGGLCTSLVVLFGIFLVGYHYSKPISSEERNVADGYEKNLDQVIKQKYSGEFTDEKVRLILSDAMDDYQDRRLASATTFPFYPFRWEVCDTFFSKDTENIYDQMIAATDKKQRLTIDDVKVNTIKELGFKEFGQPLKLENYVPWSDLYKVIGNMFVLLSVLVVLMCAVIFADDTGRNMNQLLLTTRFGRSKALIAKLGAGFLLTLLLLVVFHLLNGAIFALMYDTSGWSGSIQTNFNLMLFQFPMEWNHLQVYLCVLLFQGAGLLFTASLTIFISALAASSIAAFALSLGAYIAPALAVQVFQSGIMNQVLHLFPINMYSVEKMLTIFSLPDSFMFSSFLKNFLFVIVFLLLTKLIFEVVTYQRMRRWHFR